jgi:hypothetical protein
MTKPTSTISTLKHGFHKSHDHIFAYGCDALNMMASTGPAQVASNQLSGHMTSGAA